MLPKPNDAFSWVQAGAGPALVCRALEPYAAHLFTSRQWPLASAADDDRAAAWGDVARALDVDAAHLSRAHQVHGTSVLVRRRGDPPPPADWPLPDADIIVSDDPALALAIQTADCVPLLVADRRTVVVAALRETFGSRPEDVVAAIGPSISASRYEVGADVRDRFEAAGHSPAELAGWFLDGARPAHWQFDGWRSAREQLERAGVLRDHIYGAAFCTASYPDAFCSYRRDGKAAGRIAGAVRPRGARMP